MTTFDDRERAFENLFIHDEELRFRSLARRNKAIATWAAARMGLDHDGAAAYQNAILDFGLGQSNDDALIQRIEADLANAGQSTTADEVRTALTRCLAEAVAKEKSS